ncbi:MAG TPA: hypothetical protein PLU73_00710 [Bacteroidia bacterium]|nr:hypothetical protein [Bacteroidia bacterium]
MRTQTYIVIFFIALAAFSCKKKEEKPSTEPAVAATTPTPTSGLNENSNRYVKFTLGSQSYSYIPVIGNVWSSSSGGLSTQPFLPNYYSVYSTINGGSNFYISIGDSTRQTSPVSEAFFKSLLAVKSFPFSKESMWSSKQVGVFISVKNPANNEVYKSVNPVNNTSFQSGSSFIINENFFYTSQGSSYLDCIFKATVNCKLYSGTGDSIQLSNGEIVSTLTKF